MPLRRRQFLAIIQQMATCPILVLMNPIWIGSGTISSMNQETAISQVHNLTDLIDGGQAGNIARTKLFKHPGTDKGLLQVAERTADCMVVPWQYQEQESYKPSFTMIALLWSERF